MGKASRWFRGLLGLKNTDTHHDPSPKPPTKKKWSFAKSHKEKDRQKSQNAIVPGGEGENDASKHAIAVAAATAAVAEAAVAAAHAAAAVVHLTSSGRNINSTACISQSVAGYGSREEEWAAVMIQSHFRAYLARRALRALKALVNLQALVRGHLVRKHTANFMKRLQALARAQSRARAARILLSESPHSSVKSAHYNNPGPPTPEKFEHVIRIRSMKQDHLMMLKRNSSKSRSSEQGSYFTTTLSTNGDETSDKILEIDTGTSKCRNLFQNCQSFSTSKDSTTRLSPSSGDVQPLSPLQVDDTSPTFYSASSSRRGAFTPTRSDGCGSKSYYPDHPNYMAYTESSKAKVRSLSAPKQRPQFDRSTSSTTKRYSVHGYADSRATQKLNFASKAYPGSGRLDKLGMPILIRSDVDGFSGGHWHRY